MRNKKDKKTTGIHERHGGLNSQYRGIKALYHYPQYVHHAIGYVCNNSLIPPQLLCSFVNDFAPKTIQ